MKEISPVILRDCRYLLKRKGGYHFVNLRDLVGLFIKLFYPESTVIALLESKRMFDIIPRLTLEKRSNYGAYMMGLVNDIVFIEMPNVTNAEDFVYAIPVASKAKYWIFDHGEVVANEKGKLNKQWLKEQLKAD